MDIKRLIPAIAICLIIMLGWERLSVHMGWSPDRTQQQSQQTPAEDGAPQPTAAEPAALQEIPAFTPTPGRTVIIRTPLYEAGLYTGGGFLESFRLAQYTVGTGADEGASERVNLIGPLARSKASLGLLLDGKPTWTGAEWSADASDLRLDAGETGTVRLSAMMDGIALARELTFDADSYLIHEKITLTGAQERRARLGITVSAENLSFGASQYNETGVAWRVNDSRKEITDTDDLAKGMSASGMVQWAGVMSKYFMAAVTPIEGTDLGIRARYEDAVYRAVVEKPDVRIIPGQTFESSWNYWIGPKDRELIKNAPNDLASAIDMGWFGAIGTILLWLLNFFHSYVGNYGVAIILLTVLVKIILSPLSYKSYKSMERMKKLQPMVQKLREKHGDDRQALSRETMALYRTYKVNPAGGCLPMVVQIPVFFGLYQALLNALELRHATFIPTLPFTDMMWLADLSVKDPFYITPIVMGATMLLQQKLTPMGGDPMQAKIMMLMPIIFTFLFVNFPAGLVVYWLTNNVLSIAQQWWMLRKA